MCGIVEVRVLVVVFIKLFRISILYVIAFTILEFLPLNIGHVSYCSTRKQKPL
jgi:hypothetical protein